MNPTIDLTIDYGEIALDSIIEDDLISEIPIVKTVATVYKIGAAIKERIILKNLLVFFKEFHSGDVEKKKLANFHHKLLSNENYRKKICEIIIIYNERFTETIKSKVVAQLLLSHINQELEFKNFNNLVMIVDSIHPEGIKELANFGRDKKWGNISLQKGVDMSNASLITASGIANISGHLIKITEMGKELFQFGLKNLYK